MEMDVYSDEDLRFAEDIAYNRGVREGRLALANEIQTIMASGEFTVYLDDLGPKRPRRVSDLGIELSKYLTENYLKEK